MGAYPFFDMPTAAQAIPVLPAKYAGTRPILGPQRLGTDANWGPITLPSPPYDGSLDLSAAIWTEGGRFSVPAIPSWAPANGAKLGRVNLNVTRAATGVLSPGIHRFAVTVSDGSNVIDEVDGEIRFTEPVPPTYNASGILTVAGTEWVIVNRRRGWLVAVLPKFMNGTSHYGNNLFLDVAIGSALDRMNYRRSDLYGVTDADLAIVPRSQRDIFENLVDYFVCNNLLGQYKEVDTQDQNFLVRADELRAAMTKERDRLWKLVRRYGQGAGLYETGIIQAGTGIYGDGILGPPVPPALDPCGPWPRMLGWPWIWRGIPGNPGPYRG
jgi:hypothetical protein